MSPSSSTHSSTIRVALIGATSRIGPAIISALEASPHFTLTVLQRDSSSPPPSKHSKIITLPNDLPHAALVAALQDHDALISAMPGSAVDPQKKLADACVEAGVHHFIPADYGSVDSSDEVVAALVPLYKQKTEVREYVQKLAQGNEGFQWTSLVCGHFFDHGLHTDLLGFDVQNHKAEIFDGGDVKWSASTLPQIARGVLAVLQKPEQTRNKMLYMQSFLVTQNEVLAALEDVTGSKFEGRQVESQAYIREKKKEADAGDKAATEQLVAVLGITRANWTKNEGFANGLLGLEEEDLQDVVRRAVQEGH